jgi:predicted nucleic acid-binding Zn ribbon protein
MFFSRTYNNEDSQSLVSSAKAEVGSWQPSKAGGVGAPSGEHTQVFKINQQTTVQRHPSTAWSGA